MSQITLRGLSVVTALGFLAGMGQAQGAEVIIKKRTLVADGLFQGTFQAPSGSQDGKWPGGGPNTLELVLPYHMESISVWATEYHPKEGSQIGNAVVVTRSVQLHGVGQKNKCRVIFDVLQVREANQGADSKYPGPVLISVSIMGWANPRVKPAKSP